MVTPTAAVVEEDSMAMAISGSSSFYGFGGLSYTNGGRGGYG